MFSLQLDSVGVERVIGIFGFSLFGSLSLFPYTMDRIKEFATVNKSIVAFSLCVVWVLVSVGVLCGLQGKSDFEQAFCRFTGRLGIVGLALLVALHVWWTLPSDNTYCTAGFCALVVFALGLHLVSWGWVSNTNSLHTNKYLCYSSERTLICFCRKCRVSPLAMI